jgi:glycosyltransferase involved in cell wall biosynthesis
MKILFVATNLPLPPNNGQSIRSLSIVQALQSTGHELSFISFAPSKVPENLSSFSSHFRSVDLLEREMVNLTETGHYLRRLGSLLMCRSFSVHRFRSTAMRETIQRRLQERDFDLLVCDGMFAMVNVPETKVPIALNCHNVEHVVIQRYAKVETNPLKKTYATLESMLLQSAERRSCQQATVIMPCSKLDLEMFRSLCRGARAFVVPNVIETDLVRPIVPDGYRKPVLLFQGGMDWYPNRDAVEHFVRKVLPRVRVPYPETRLIVAGRNPPIKFVEQFRSDAGIDFTGTVPDMRPYLAAASVVIVPLRVGGGTRIKILEACGAGRPVVSTRLGAEGLDLTPGKEIAVADDPDEFAYAIIQLLQNPDQTQTMVDSARAAVVERYNCETLRRSLEAVISNMPRTS